MVKISSENKITTITFRNLRGGFILIPIGVLFLIISLLIIYINYNSQPPNISELMGDKYAHIKISFAFFLFFIVSFSIGVASYKKNKIIIDENLKTISVNQLKIPFSDIKNFIWVHRPEGFMTYYQVQCVKNDSSRIDLCLPDNKRKEQEKIIEVLKSKGFEVKDALFELENKT